MVNGISDISMPKVLAITHDLSVFAEPTPVLAVLVISGVSWATGHSFQLGTGATMPLTPWYGYLGLGAASLASSITNASSTGSLCLAQRVYGDWKLLFSLP